MGFSKTIADLAASLFVDADFDATAEVVKASSAVLYAIEIDNSANTVASYAKFWNATSATVGTTAPDMVLKVPAGESLTVMFPGGLTFGTGLTVACTTAGGTAGTGAPANDVSLELAYT